MKVIVTRHETVERHWGCVRCGAFGEVVLRARGSDSKEVWFSRDDAEADAAENARWAVQRDAERTMGLIVCPTCHLRAPGAMLLWTAWVLINVIAAAILAVVVLLELPTVWWVAPIALVGVPFLSTLNARRRLREARMTIVMKLAPGTVDAPAPPAQVPARRKIIAAPTPPPTRIHDDPFRDPPRPAPIELSPAEVRPVTTPVVAGDPADKPKILV